MREGETQRAKVKVSKSPASPTTWPWRLPPQASASKPSCPARASVGVEVPNHESNVVGLKELMESEAFQGLKGKLGFVFGEDVKGQPIVSDPELPHLLIAGATGSGKSVCINSIIACLLLSHTPDSLRLLMIDPKMVELSMYNGIPHLLSPVVTEIDRASGCFWAVKKWSVAINCAGAANARDIERYKRLPAQTQRKTPALHRHRRRRNGRDDGLSVEEVEKHICRIAPRWPALSAST